jgi:hypothetical protein
MIRRSKNHRNLKCWCLKFGFLSKLSLVAPNPEVVSLSFACLQWSVWFLRNDWKVKCYGHLKC